MAMNDPFVFKFLCTLMVFAFLGCSALAALIYACFGVSVPKHQQKLPRLK